jgi:hypothetical protein
MTQGERRELDDVLGEGQDRLDDEARLRMGRVSDRYATYRSNDLPSDSEPPIGSQIPPD